MKLFLIAFFTGLTSVSFGQSQITDYTLNIDFAPSFISRSKLLIKVHANTCFISLATYGPKMFGKNDLDYKDSAYVRSDLVSPLTEFMKTYKLQIKGSIDTIGKFKGGFSKDDTTTHYDITVGLDGINVYGDFNKNNTGVKKFAFWSPKKGTANDELSRILFRLMYATLKNEQMVNYLEQLEQYFPHQLGLKKIAGKPLTYKLYGGISGAEQTQLNAFFILLPNNQDILIDVSNLDGMDSIFYPIIKNYCDQNSRIYWINANDRVMGILFKIGIASKNVVSKKKVIRIDKDGWKEKVIFEDK